MHVIRNTDKSQKVAVDTSPIDLGELTFKEIGMLMPMLVYPHKSFSLKELSEGAKDGIDSTRTGMNSLIQKGKVKKLANGRYEVIIPTHS